MRLLVILFPLAIAAQPVVTVTGPATIPAGKPATLTVSVSGTAGSNLAAIQLSMAVSAGALGASVTVPTAYSTSCNAAGTCVTYSCNAAQVCSLSTLADGAVFTIPITFPAMSVAPIPVATSGLLGASTAGAAVTLTAGAPYSLTVGPSACSVLGQATITAKDAIALVQAIIGQAPCPTAFAAGCSLDNLEAVIIAATGGACIL